MSLPYAVLGILTYMPMNGYQLRKIFDRSVNYFWTASLSQIYRELGVLESKGYVTSSIQPQDDRPDKKIYNITDGGKKAFMDWLADFPETLSSVKRDEFSLRIFFGSKLEKAELKKQFERFITEREAFRQSMVEGKKQVVEIVKAIKTNLADEELSMRFIAKRAMMTNEVLIQWARECIEELDKAPNN